MLLLIIFSTDKGCGVKDVVEGMEYEFRVAAINGSGAGEFSVPSEFVFARDPKRRPHLFFIIIYFNLISYLLVWQYRHACNMLKLPSPI